MKNVIFLIVIILLISGGFLIWNLQKEETYDDILEPVYTQDCFPRTLKNMGVTEECFEKANFGDNSFCSDSQIKMIQEYYEKGQDKDPLNDGTGNFCANELN
jgi:hypothetical protein